VGGPVSATRRCLGYRRDAVTDGHADAHHLGHCGDRQQPPSPAAAQRHAERTRHRPTRDCAHPCHPHRHGQRVAYVRDRCRCAACTAANTAAGHAAARAQALGQPGPLLDVGGVRAHLQQLRRAHIGYEQISRLSGTSSTHVREIAGVVARSGHRPPIRRIRADLAARLLAIEPTPANRAAHCPVDATGTRRRLEALVAIGWPPARLAELLGTTRAGLRRTMTSPTITERTARPVRDLYNRLWDTQPPRNTAAERDAADTAGAHAAQHAWATPLAWDDIDTDPRPPGDQPPKGGQVNPRCLDEIAINRAVAGDRIRLGDLTPAEQAEAVHRLTQHGKSIRDIADLLATTKRTVSRRRKSTAHAARPDQPRRHPDSLPRGSDLARRPIRTAQPT